MVQRNYKFKIKSIKTIDKELCKFMKVCSKCRQLKLLIIFVKDKSKQCGYRNHCKQCEALKRKNKYKHKCLTCNKEFTSREKTQKFCSIKCRDNYKKTYYLNSIKCICVADIKICKKCGKIKPINKFSENRNICMKCRREASKNIIAKCDYCGGEYNANKYSYNNSKYHFCSNKCHAKWNSENLIGENNPNWNNHILKGKYIGENNPSWIPKEKVICPNCGIEFEVSKFQINRTVNNFCSIKCRGEFFSGENNPNWNSSKTQKEREIDRSYSDYRKFVIDVFERDNYTCQLTGQVGGKLIVHHLDGYNWCKEKRTNPNNAITLTREIHNLFHKIYGKGNNTKEQFEEFKNRFKNGEFEEVV